ncbi:MAG TPA: antitoxin [Arachnia sp.]|nr:antitoxin [Arachnia sp.]
MGLFDNIGDLAKQHEEQIEAGIDQGGDLIDEKTGGKYAGQVDQAQAFANEKLDSATGDQAPPARS